MKSKIQVRLQELSNEIESLHTEREAIFKRNEDIQVRMHQLVGAVYELQKLMVDPDRQPSALDPIYQQAEWEAMSRNLSTRPSGDVDQDNHQEQPIEIEKNSQPQS